MCIFSLILPLNPSPLLFCSHTARTSRIEKFLSMKLFILFNVKIWYSFSIPNINMNVLLIYWFPQLLAGDWQISLFVLKRNYMG